MILLPRGADFECGAKVDFGTVSQKWKYEEMI